MKSLCITGNTQAGVDHLANLVIQGGAQAALPAPRTPEVSMADWHQAVLGQFAGSDIAQGSMGRVWDQLAGDIFLANRMQPLWFWADARSTALLDFWQGFDLNTRFVLVYTDPATALEQALSSGQIAESQLDEFLAQWQQASRQMLRFHLRQPQRSLLVSHDVDSDPYACVSLLNDRLGLAGLLSLPVQEDAPSATDTPDWLPSFMQTDAPAKAAADVPAEPVTLVRHLVSQYLEEHPQALALHDEVMACITLVGEHAAPVITPLSPRAALGRFMQEDEQQSEAARALEARITGLQAELQSANAWKQRAEEKAAQLQRAESELKAANERIAALGKLEAELKDATEENELLLEQLHIVQEELEKAFEWKAKAEAETAKLKKTEAELKAAKDKSNTLDAQLKKALEELKASNEKAAKLDLQAKKTAEELKLANDKAAKLDALSKKTVEELKASNDKAAKLDAQLKKTQADLKATSDKLATEGKQKVSALESQLKDVNEENELLLEQLHLVQEELERYYLNLKQAEADKLQVQNTVAELEKRLARVFERYPDHWVCEQVSVLPLPAEGDTEVAEWTLKELETAGRYIPELKVKTVLRNGKAGLLILRDDEGNGPLERWPAAFAQTEELPCMVTEGGPLSGSNLALSSLSPADWEVLKNVVVFLVSRLESTPPGRLPPGISGTRLMRALAEFAQALRNWPTLMRFKDISIAPIHSIPNYAGLSIDLKGAKLGDQKLDQLSYRLASVDTVAGNFGQDPRLEFPESSRSVLKTWFTETSDDRGQRLEIRFAKPSAFDMNVWNRLGAQDQALIAALLTAMPIQLGTLEANTVAGLARPAGDWQELSAWMTRTLANQLSTRRRPAQVA